MPWYDMKLRPLRLRLRRNFRYGWRRRQLHLNLNLNLINKEHMSCFDKYPSSGSNISFSVHSSFIFCIIMRRVFQSVRLLEFYPFFTMKIIFFVFFSLNLKFSLYFTMKMAKKLKKRHKGKIGEKSSYIGFFIKK